MKITKYLVIAVLGGLLIACGSENGNEKEEPQGVIPEHQLKALEKAKSVEQALLDAEEERKKEMEDQGI